MFAILITLFLIQDFKITPGFRITPGVAPVKSSVLPYGDACVEAKKSGKVQVTWSGLFPGNIPNVVHAVTDKGMVLPDWWPKKGIVVSIWLGDNHYGKAVAVDKFEDVTSVLIRKTVHEIRESLGDGP